MNNKAGPKYRCLRDFKNNIREHTSLFYRLVIFEYKQKWTFFLHFACKEIVKNTVLPLEEILSKFHDFLVS